MTTPMTLKQQIKQAFPELTESDFGGHASDLYVLMKPGILEWLKKNHPHPHRNCVKVFAGSGDWAGKLAIEIAFGRMDEYVAAKPQPQTEPKQQPQPQLQPTMRPNVEPTLADVDAVCQIAVQSIREYLRVRVGLDSNGFPRTALTGDEDPETTEEYCQVYQPLHRQLRELQELLVSKPILTRVLESEQTWHSKQYRIVVCAGDESDRAIANIYRSLIS